MKTLEFSSEYFDADELLAYLREQKVLESKTPKAVVSSMSKDGDERAGWSDFVQLTFDNPIIEQGVVGLFYAALGYAAKSAKGLLDAEPYILVRFSNGATRKILYDKGDDAIVQELLSYIEGNDVVRVIFKC